MKQRLQIPVLQSRYLQILIGWIDAYEKGTLWSEKGSHTKEKIKLKWRYQPQKYAISNMTTTMIWNLPTLTKTRSQTVTHGVLKDLAGTKFVLLKQVLCAVQLLCSMLESRLRVALQVNTEGTSYHLPYFHSWSVEDGNATNTHHNTSFHYTTWYILYW